LILNLVFWLAPDIRRPKSDGGQVITIARVATSPMSSLILKRAPIGPNQEDYDVLADGIIAGRIFLSPAAPPDRPWMWASGHNGDIRRAVHGYEPTREAAMVAFAKSWRKK
jgi:hypothetical protein